MASKTELSVIVVTYEAADLVFPCLESLKREMQATRGEVCIVDNGSTSDLAERIASQFPDFLVKALPSNSGYAAAANYAAGFARGSYLLFLNPDTVIPKGSIQSLLAFSRRTPRAGMWGGRTVFADNTLNPHSCRRAPSTWGLFCSALALDTRFADSPLFGAFHYGGWRRDTEREVEVVCGCYLLVERDLWDRLAGFSPAYYMYGEDDDLCVRARRLGFAPSFTPQSSIVHHGSGSESNQERKLCQLLAARSVFVRQHFPAILRPVALAFLALRPWLGRFLAKPRLRGLWANIWASHELWLSGRFVISGTAELKHTGRRPGTLS